MIQTGEKILPVVREGRKNIRQIPDVGILFCKADSGRKILRAEDRVQRKVWSDFCGMQRNCLCIGMYRDRVFRIPRGQEEKDD